MEFSIIKYNYRKFTIANKISMVMSKKKGKTVKQKPVEEKKQTNPSKKIFYVTSIILLGILVYLFLPGKKIKKYNNSPDKTKLEHSAFTFTKHGELSFLKKDGSFITKIDIEIANNDETRARGLMYRSNMKENQGMLFIFPQERYQSFWMKDTVIPLDMIFVNANREIVTIHKNTTPYSLKSYPSDKPAKYVIEVNAGFTDKYNIQIGDKIVWRRN